MYKQVLLQKMKGDKRLEIYYGIYINRLKEETHKIISIDTEKVAEKYPIPIHILKSFLK